MVRLPIIEDRSIKNRPYNWEGIWVCQKHYDNYYKEIVNQNLYITENELCPECFKRMKLEMGVSQEVKRKDK